MEVPEWVRVVRCGNEEDVTNFIAKNPGHDWENSTFLGCTAVFYAIRYNNFPRAIVEILLDKGGVDINTVCIPPTLSLLEDAISLGWSNIGRMLLQRGAIVKNDSLLWKSSPWQHWILHESTTLSRELVNKALVKLNNTATRTPRWNISRTALLSWLSCHDKRRESTLVTAWIISQLPGQWPDMSELVTRRMMEIMVMEW
jgi:hypothetical protein